MDTTTTLLYNALKELRRFVVDNMDALPNSEAVRFNTLKALNEFDVAEFAHWIVSCIVMLIKATT